MHDWQRQLQRSPLGPRALRSCLRGRFFRVLRVPLLRIFGFDTSKSLASNPKFLLLTLKLYSIHTHRYFVAHMFTSTYCVADVVPADRQECEQCQAPSLIRLPALSHTGLVNGYCALCSVSKALAHLRCLFQVSKRSKHHVNTAPCQLWRCSVDR